MNTLNHDYVISTVHRHYVSEGNDGAYSPDGASHYYYSDPQTGDVRMSPLALFDDDRLLAQSHLRDETVVGIRARHPGTLEAIMGVDELSSKDIRLLELLELDHWIATQANTSAPFCDLMQSGIDTSCQMVANMS